MRSLIAAKLSLVFVIAFFASVSQNASAQTIPYFAVGQGAEYNPVTNDYFGRGIGFPLGRQAIDGNVVPDGAFFPRDGVFFEGTFEGSQVNQTFLGEIHSTLTGTVLLEFDENGMVVGTWFPSFEVDGGTGIFWNASGRLEGVAINPPFNPESETWAFNWRILGRINLNWWH